MERRAGGGGGDQEERTGANSPTRTRLPGVARALSTCSAAVSGAQSGQIRFGAFERLPRDGVGFVSFIVMARRDDLGRAGRGNLALKLADLCLQLLEPVPNLLVMALGRLQVAIALGERGRGGSRDRPRLLDATLGCFALLAGAPRRAGLQLIRLGGCLCPGCSRRRRRDWPGGRQNAKSSVRRWLDEPTRAHLVRDFGTGQGGAQRLLRLARHGVGEVDSVLVGQLVGAAEQGHLELAALRG